jgi:DNA-binding transcriptional LysR family regulator
MQQLMALAQERNFTRAANVIGMTQPALSRAIASLEAEAGLMLFERFPTGVSPTAAGDELIHEARRILGSVALVEHNVRQRGRGDLGNVNFALGPLAASCMLKRILTDTLTVAPQLAMSAVVRETSAIVEGVMEGEFDFGICSANTLKSRVGIETIPLASFPMGMFVRSGHPLLSLDRDVEWNDLIPYPRITGRYPQSSRLNTGRPFGPLDTTVECNDFAVLRATTAATDAIWLTAIAILEGEETGGSLVSIDPQPFHDLAVAEIVLVRQTDRLLDPAAERIIRLIMSTTASFTS